jgi:streptogramin lyase
MLLSDPKAMAFDRQGNLWVGFFGPNVIAKIPVSHQKQSATITPEVQLTLTVGVLLNSLAFDEAGGLWTAMASGKFGRLSPGQLGNAGKVTPEIVVSSTELKYAGGLAFYPIPEGLPLR